MSRSILAGAVCALWLAAGSVAAEPFEKFVDFCLDTNADRQAAGGRAKAVGWFAMPRELMDPDEIEFRDAAIFLSADPQTAGAGNPPKDLGILVTGWSADDGPFALDGIKIDLCIVMGVDSDHATLSARMEERLGFAAVDMYGDEGPMEDEEVAAGWVFSREGRRFRSEAALIDLDDSELPRIARERKLYFAIVIEEDGMAGVALGAVRPAD